MTSTVDCIVIGGGFTGLAAALDLCERGHSVTLLEKDAALGGLAGTFRVGDTELEKFYHHWFTSDRHIAAIAAQIGHEADIVTRSSRTGMYYSGNFFRLSTPMDLLRFPAIPLASRIRTGLATLAIRRKKNWRSLESLTARDWLRSLFGQAATEVIWEPLLIGKFGQYANDVSAVWFWNKLSLRGGSRGKGGAEMLSYYRGGFGALARHIGERIEQLGGKIRTSMGANSVSSAANGMVQVLTAERALQARSVLITTPLPHAADLLEGATSDSYSKSLRRIKYLANVCLVLELDRSLSDVYWLNVNDPSFPFVGVIEHTNFELKQTYGGRHIVYLSKYLPEEDPLFAMDASRAFEFATPHLQRMFPKFETSWVRAVHIWRAKYAQPIVERHYSSLIPGFATPLPNVFLATMAQVYPEDRGTNYAVREGKLAAEKIHAVFAIATKIRGP